MCALNNVGGQLDARFPNGRVYDFKGKIIVRELGASDGENYESQSAFATAYGLITGA